MPCLRSRLTKFGRLAAPALRGRNHPRVRPVALAHLDGALVLQVEVLEHRLAVLRRVLQGEQQARLLNVDVVARAPLDRRQRRVGPVPLLARVGVDDPVRRPVALGLVEPADRVVQVRDPEQVVRRPPVVERPGPHAGHAALGQFRHFVLRQHPPLVGQHGIDGHVVRAGAGRGVQVVRRFMQVVHHRRVPLEVGAQERVREIQAEAQAVAVVVVRDVLAPPDERHPLARVLLLVVEVVHHLLAAVHFDDRRQEDDDVVADVLDERRLLDDQPIGQLHLHLGAARLARVQVAARPVDRLAGGDERLRLRVGQLPRVGEVGEDLLVLVEGLDRRLVGDGHDDDVAAFLALADGPHLRAARRRLGQRVEVALHVLVVVQLVRRAGNPPEELERRRHGGRRGQMVDQFGQDPRILRVFLDLRRVLGVDLLRRGDFPLRCAATRQHGRAAGEDEAEQARQKEHAREAPWHREPPVVSRVFRRTRAL